MPMFVEAGKKGFGGTSKQKVRRDKELGKIFNSASAI
jgi:hypothetical protein